MNRKQKIIINMIDITFNGVESASASTTAMNFRFYTTKVINAANEAWANRKENDFIMFYVGKYKVYVEKDRSWWNMSIFDTEKKDIIEKSPLTMSFMWGKEIDHCILDRRTCNYLNDKAKRWSKDVVMNIAYIFNTTVIDYEDKIAC